MPAARPRPRPPAWAPRTALVTHTFATIGEMSCNPAIGGLGKGHLVREIDALDGLMGRVADAAGIQFRLLNRSKGPAVQGPRAQADRKLYRQAMQAAIRETARPRGHRGRGRGPDRGRRPGLRRGSQPMAAGSAPAPSCSPPAPSSTASSTSASRRSRPAVSGEAPALRLSERLYGLGLQLGRLKTGTPPRLLASSIDWDALEKQAGDDPPVPFSFLTSASRRRRSPAPSRARPRRRTP